VVDLLPSKQKQVIGISDGTPCVCVCVCVKLLYFTGDNPSLSEELTKHLQNKKRLWSMADNDSIPETDSESVMGVALPFQYLCGKQL